MSQREKKFEYLTKVAVECAEGESMDDCESSLAFIQYAAEYAGQALDCACLIGLTCRLRAKLVSVRLLLV